METWPPTSLLPRPSVGFSGLQDANCLRLKFDSNTSRQRRLYSQPHYKFAVAWSFTQVQLDLFEAFMRHKLSDGCDPVRFPVNLGNGFEFLILRFTDGQYTTTYEENDSWRVSAELETVRIVSFCTPNIDAFLTVPLGIRDLSAWFGSPVASPGAATEWRIVTDDCGYDEIIYYTGQMNADGSLNPGLTWPDPRPATGWVASLLGFYSSFSHPEGMYLQVRCGGVWAERPCIVGGDE